MYQFQIDLLCTKIPIKIQEMYEWMPAAQEKNTFYDLSE